MPSRLRLHPRNICIQHQQHRLFTCTSQSFAPPRTNPLSLLPPNAPPAPPYPYGRSYFYKQRDTGLYGGAMIQFGNNVSERTETKTRRVWNPNVQFKSIFSPTLGRAVRVKVSTRVLRTIDKVGGLDQYLLGDTAERVKELGEQGWKLRWAVLNHPSTRRKIDMDARLRGMLQGYGKAMESPATVELVQQPKRGRTGGVGYSRSEVEARIGRSIREVSHMGKEQEASSLWQRLRQAVTRPFRRD